MSRRILSGAAILLAACEPTGPARVEAPADSAAGEIAFELAGASDAAILVPVTINGAGPFDFVLDTGATVTCIDEALADSLQLPPLRGVIGMGAGATSAGRLRMVEIDSLRVGAAGAEEMAGCVLDLSHVQDVGFDTHGLLGLNFLKAFRVSLDFERNVLILQAPAD